MDKTQVPNQDAMTLAPRDAAGTPPEAQTVPPDAPSPGLPSTGAYTLDPSKGQSGQAPTPSIPGYEILGELGRGGMGVVYKARQQALKRLVALKMILTGAHAGAAELARFRGEAEAVARLQHPNIVQVHEVGESEGFPFFSLEFIDGGSLAEKLNGMPQLPAVAAQLTLVLAEAVHYAHQHGIIHRDLKPANILLQQEEQSGKETMVRPSRWGSTVTSLAGASRRSGALAGALPFGIPKITDFGLAKPVEGETGLTKSGAIVGTPSYMAPEQADNKQVGPAADVYALGAILYEILTGRPPFRAGTQLDTILLLISEEPVPPSRLQPKLPRDLETICLKCLEKDQRKRYECAAALADDLGRFLNNEPILARPIGYFGRAAKWARRRPAAAALIGVIALALIAVGVIMVAFNLSLQHERDYALKLKEIADEERDAAHRAKEEAHRQRERAQANFDKAREAVDQLLTRVGDQKFKNVPLLEELQKELLEEALKFNQQFLEEKSDDAVVRLGTSRAYTRAGGMRSMLGQHAEAVAAHQEASNLLRALHVEYPGNPLYRRELARSCQALSGPLSMLLRYKEAGAALQEALALIERLRAEHPDELQYRADLALAYHRHGKLHWDMASFGEAKRGYEKAIALFEELVAEHPQEADYRWNLSQSLNSLGIWEANTTAENKSRLERADGLFRRAAAHFETLVKAEPKNPAYREDLARTNTNLGNISMMLQKPEEAETHYKQTIAILDELATDFPKVPHYRSKSALASFNLGLGHHTYGRKPEAETNYRRSATTYAALMAEFPKLVEYRQQYYGVMFNLAAVLAEQGKKPEAEQTLRRAIEVCAALVADLPDSRYNHTQLGNMLDELAGWLIERNELAEARKRLDQAVRHQGLALKVLPGDHRYLRSLNQHRLKLIDIDLKEKDHAAAAAAAAELVRTEPKLPASSYNAACVLARCIPIAAKDEKLPEAERQALAQIYADRALLHLQDASGKGFKNAEELQKDADLAPLRDRDDFKKLVKELAEKGKAEKK